MDTKTLLNYVDLTPYQKKNSLYNTERKNLTARGRNANSKSWSENFQSRFPSNSGLHQIQLIKLSLSYLYSLVDHSKLISI